MGQDKVEQTHKGRQHMIMIPLPFLFSLAAMLVAWRMSKNLERQNWWMIGFLCLFALQELLIGTRYGYGVEWIKFVQPISAAMLAPAAYLGFRNPPLGKRTLLHLIPLTAVITASWSWLVVMDLVLALTNVTYAGLLAALGLRGADALDWAPLSRMRSLQRLLWVTVMVLLVSGLTDALISLDFWRTDGANTSNIVGAATLFGFATLLGLLVLNSYRAGKTATALVASDVPNKAAFDTLDANLKSSKLYSDPDINLGRIARRLRLPSRDVSRAINTHAGENVSQYINRLRINEACQMLAETDMQVTQVIYAVGFNTKSNFNREFARITGDTPSAWRAKAG